LSVSSRCDRKRVTGRVGFGRTLITQFTLLQQAPVGGRALVGEAIVALAGGPPRARSRTAPGRHRLLVPAVGRGYTGGVGFCRRSICSGASLARLAPRRWSSRALGPPCW
jgi:hypothetical protein